MTFMLRSFDRSVYSTLDYLADIGGLFSSIQVPFNTLIGMMNFWGAYQFVMADNFAHRLQRRDDDPDSK